MSQKGRVSDIQQFVTQWQECAKSGHSATVREQVWIVPADQGLFFGGALIVGAVMSSTFRAENRIRWP